MGIVWWSVVAVLVLVYCYGWLMWELNSKSLEWFNMLAMAREEGTMTNEDVEFHIANPPWFVRVVKAIDIGHRIPERWTRTRTGREDD